MSNERITFDPSKQRILIRPGDPLPDFFPTPRFVELIPIYDETVVTRSAEHRTYAGSPSRSPSRSTSHSPTRSSIRGGYTDSEMERRSRGPYYPPRKYHDRDSDGYSDRGPPRHSRYYQYPETARYSYRPSQPPSTQLWRTNAPSRYAPSSADTASLNSFDSRGRPIPVDRARGLDLEKNLQDLVQKYLQTLPVSKAFTYSRCTGKKKAVCIGINYRGQRDELRGCCNDARHMRDFLMKFHGFKPADILLLVDDGDKAASALPTRAEMLKAMKWLVTGAHDHDSLFFHYSGHGGQKRDDSGREADGYDEVIFPVDYKQTKDLVDDELHQALVQPLPPGCRLTAIFDACHSGTVLDLPYLHSAHGRLRSMRHISKRAISRKVAPASDVICFAACKDDETSADTFHGDVATGAMSWALIRCLERNPRQTYGELLQHLRELLIPRYHQKAQLSGTHPVDLNRQFTL